jgi:nucleoside-diphosphate-sugar epimerase
MFKRTRPGAGGVLITGSGGVIGTTLVGGLGMALSEFDLPSRDARDYKTVVRAAGSCRAIVHLAWDSRVDYSDGDQLDPANILAAQNVYRAAVQARVPRVIMASSIHADDFRHATPANPMRTERVPWPTGPYGAAKCAIEALGRHYATRGLEVVCVRFGGITGQDRPAGPGDVPIWLSHQDCVACIQAILEARAVPGGWACLYAISANEGLAHDLSNPFGWRPSRRGAWSERGFEQSSAPGFL